MSEEEKRVIDHERYKNKLKKEKRRKKREENKANYIKNTNKKLSVRQKNKDKRNEEKAKMVKLKEEIKNLKNEIKTLRSITKIKTKTKTKNNKNFTYLTTFDDILETNKDLNDGSKIIKLNENKLIKNELKLTPKDMLIEKIIKKVKLKSIVSNKNKLN
jgi:hypothetical protein